MEIKEKLSKEEYKEQYINLFKDGKINRKNIKKVIPIEYLNDGYFWSMLTNEGIDLFNFLDLIPQDFFNEYFYFKYLKDDRTTAEYAKRFLPKDAINDYSFWSKFNNLHNSTFKYINIIPNSLFSNNYYLKDIKNELESFEGNFYGLDKQIPKRLYYSPKFWLDIVNLNISNSTDVLKYAPDIIKDNYTIMLTAIKKNSYALEDASDRLKNNIRLVLLAISKNSYTFKFASKELQKNPKVLKMFYKKRKLEKYETRKNDVNNQLLSNDDYSTHYLNEGLFDIFKNKNPNINTANKLALANNIDEDTVLKFANLDLTKAKKLTTKFIQFYIDSNKSDELFNIINQFNQIYNNDPTKVEQVSSTILKLNNYLNFAEYVDSKLGKTSDNEILYKNKTWINDDKLAELGITPIYSDSKYSLYLADTEAKAVILTQNRTFCIGRDNGQHNHFDDYRFNANNEHTFYFLYRKGLVVNPIIRIEVIGINNEGQYQHTDGLNRTKDGINIDKWLQGKPEQIKELIKANPYNKLELYLKNNILNLEPNKKKYLYNKLVEQYLTNNISGNRLMSLKYIINKSGDKVKEIFIDYIEDKFKEGKSFWVFLVFNNGFGLEYVPKEEYKTEQMCVIGISYYNMSNYEQEIYMKYIPEKMLSSKSFWELLNRDNGIVGEYIKYIPEGLFKGKEIVDLIKNTFEVYERINRNSYALLFENLAKFKDVLNNKDIVDLLNKEIEKKPVLIKYLHNFKDKLSSKDIIHLWNKVIEKYVDAIQYLDNFKDVLNSDYIIDLWNKAIEKNPVLIKYLDKFKDVLNSDYIINLFNKVIEKDTYFIQYLKDFKDVLSSEEIVNLFNQAIQKDTYTFHYLKEFNDKLSSEEIVNLFNQAIQKDPETISLLQYFKDKLTNKEIVNLFNQAIQKNLKAFYYLRDFKDKLSTKDLIIFFNQAIKKEPHIISLLQEFNDKFTNEEIVNLFNQAIDEGPGSIFYLSNFKDKFTNKEIVNLFNQAIQKDPHVVYYLENFKDKLSSEEIESLEQLDNNIKNNSLLENYIRNKVKNLLKENTYNKFLKKEQIIFSSNLSYEQYVKQIIHILPKNDKSSIWLFNHHAAEMALEDNKIYQAKKHIDLAMKYNIFGNSITNMLDFIINNKGTKEQLKKFIKDKITDTTEKETALELFNNPKYGGILK